MTLLTVLILFSSVSFLGYGVAYFVSPNMKAEFKCFGLGRVGLIAIVFELLGATGLLLGLRSYPILLVSSGGLALLMFLAVATRLRMRDGLLVSLPLVFYMLLNAYIFTSAR